MKIWLALIGCLLSSAALAQAPTLPPQLAPVTTSGLTSAEITPTHWVARAVPLLRWPDGQGTVAMLEAGTEVTVILREEDQVRVRRELDFGWVPADAVVDQPPAAEPD